jgi:putative SOS response-associated peptidase YedK
MCAYVRRHINNKDLKAFAQSIGMLDLFQGARDESIVEHFYAAFGGAAHKQLKSMIIRKDNQVKTVDATWWYECSEADGRLIVDNRLTTFNARNLHQRYWKGAIRHHRGIVLATGLGEGNEINGKKRNYLVESTTPILLGAVFQSFPAELYSAAIITRAAHPRFKPYHDDAFPLFLPINKEFVELWLSDEPETHPEIAALLDNPRIFTELNITQVKTFKDGVHIGATEALAAD